jgi:hypothetical protein
LSFPWKEAYYLSKNDDYPLNIGQGNLDDLAICTHIFLNLCRFWRSSVMDIAVAPNKVSEKHEKFRALAESRTNKAIEAILRIGNLSNRQIYDFDESEVRKVTRALKEAVSLIESRFESPRGKSGGSFRL